jgi:hypothetical protein
LGEECSARASYCSQDTPVMTMKIWSCPVAHDVCGYDKTLVSKSETSSISNLQDFQICNYQIVFPELSGQYDTIEVGFSNLQNTTMLAVVSDYYTNAGAREFVVSLKDTIVIAYPYSLFLVYTAETLQDNVAKFNATYKYIDRDPNVVAATMSAEERNALMVSTVGIYVADPRIEIVQNKTTVWLLVLITIVICIIAVFTYLYVKEGGFRTDKKIDIAENKPLFELQTPRAVNAALEDSEISVPAIEQQCMQAYLDTLEIRKATEEYEEPVSEQTVVDDLTADIQCAEKSVQNESDCEVYFYESKPINCSP